MIENDCSIFARPQALCGCGEFRLRNPAALQQCLLRRRQPATERPVDREHFADRARYDRVHSGPLGAVTDCA